MTKTAIVTGIAGQDGSYLAERLIADGVRVLGYTRAGSDGLKNATHLSSHIDKISFPFDDAFEWDLLLEREQPDYFFHLAGNSFVPESWEKPVASIQSNVVWITNIFESVRRLSPRTRVVVASSSEIFGRASDTAFNESTPIHPGNPYGVTKAASFLMIELYRQRYGLFGSNAILFNHESPRRAFHFVTRKVSRAVAGIILGTQSELTMGSLDASRDWGHAIEYVDAMYRMILADQPGDFVIGSGKTVPLHAVVEHAFGSVGLDFQKYVKTDSAFVRPPEPFCPRADSSKAHQILGWQATRSIESTIAEMVASDIRLGETELGSLRKVA